VDLQGPVLVRADVRLSYVSEGGVASGRSCGPCRVSCPSVLGVAVRPKAVRLIGDFAAAKQTFKLAN